MILISSFIASLFVVVTISPSESANTMLKKENESVASFSKLPLKEEEKAIIESIITTMAQKNILQLGLSKGRLEKNGKKINHVHPLKFIGHIISDPELKNCLKAIHKSGFKWQGFSRGFVGRVKEESKKNNLLVHIPGFAKEMHVNEKQMKQLVEEENWEGLLNFLVDRI